ncbi:MAG: N-acetyltransferase [Spirochaetes bacterium]|nr:MAG: N-acetyltransferase [Spirochaetota bacterium]
MTDIQVRQAHTGDERFIHSSWFQSYWKATASKSVPREIYKSEQDNLIDRLIRGSRIVVAFLEEVPDEILGYSISTPEVCHWVYVKGVYRRRGIASQLMPHSLKYFSHWPDSSGRKFFEKFGLQFNPYTIHTQRMS